jgi:N-acetylmuramoyl-L-alanine amidase
MADSKKRRGAGDPWAVGIAARVVVLVGFVVGLAVPFGVLPIIAAIPSSGATGDSTPGSSGLQIIPLPSATPTLHPVMVDPTPSVPYVGIIAGHAGSDSGALCPDGLQEVDINMQIARRTVEILQLRGWRVDLLEEFDERLRGYEADALVSIHADSCTYPGKSGFKVARAESSYIPGAEDELVRCLSRYYQARTGLPFDANTITYDMTRYHAYYEIHEDTPAAIIEVGFMLDDRDLLTERPDVVAQGIVDGLICFVEGEEAP